MLDRIAHDLRYSARRLLARPAFAAVVVLSLALGIGANSAVFSAIYGLILKPLPYPHSEQLVQIYNSYPNMGVADSKNQVADYLDRRGQADALADIALYYDYSYDLADPDGPQRLHGVVATPSLFSTLGVQASLGRVFTADEAQAGNEQVVLLSDGLWRGQFAADPNIVGRKLRLSGRAYEVIGVMPADFAFPQPKVRLWVPFVFSELQLSDALRGYEFALSIGRLKADATIAQLEAQFAAIIRSNIERLGGAQTSGSDPGGSSWAARAVDRGFAGRAVPLHTYQLGDRTAVLWLLQAAVALVLVIACANVVNLMLIDCHRRRRELGVRAALGASRTQIVRQLLIDSALISTISGVLGAFVAYLAMHLLRLSGLDGAASGFAIELNAQVLLFALSCMLLTTVSCGLIPAIGLGRDGALLLPNAGSRGSLGSRPARYLRACLVVMQISLSVTLLAAGGLLLRSFVQLSSADPGFQSAELVSVSGQLSSERYAEREQRRAFLDELLRHARQLPGVRSVGLIDILPFSADFGSAAYFLDGDRPGDGNPRIGNMRGIDEELFATMKMPLLQGRGFLVSDDDDAPLVTIIDADLAKRAFGERSPIGERIATGGFNGDLEWRTVIGVVASIKSQSLAQQSDIATFYWPYRQSSGNHFRLIINSAAPLGQLQPLLNAAVRQIDPEQPLYDFISMDQRIDSSLSSRQQSLQLVVLFAGLALVLAAIGTYAVLAFGVAQRRSEIGLRLSLGARPADILRLILIDGARLVVIGLLLGLLAWLLLGRVIESQLYAVEASDPTTLCFVLTMTGVVALLAMWLPARRAADIAPVEALRGG